MEVMDKQTRELIENVIAVGVEYGIDIVGAIVLLVVGWIVAGWIRRVIRRTLDRVPALDETLKPFIANLVRYVVLIFVLIAVLNQFGVQTTSMIAVLAAAGVEAGLTADLAMRLAGATVRGAGELAQRSEDGPDQLRVNVTSPGGTTAAALEVLMAEDGLARLMKRAVLAATERSKALAG